MGSPPRFIKKTIKEGIHLKKEFLQLLKLAKMPRPMKDIVRFYTAQGPFGRTGWGTDWI